ncbi:hypothetical protein CONPUDRAFT_155544 [Coniophora puteana RWD-64-598 SS2]|uniref:Extracellular membrane protein CFEM domain-containing protein n=1 Tax=Coniophora puteana (strain RWD-64-598) TaxID=741705 RepID=A0A5M3MIJ2_CONPW|nr:uncharacterized protein CONPUDRAFT_155544 [Coniophora puteana RWD-64-598 SS2]EIW78826.1 hypothetical protein CONPUDRAFT_155544 [Coniophora puteana RWD-64-598 SS2]
MHAKLVLSIFALAGAAFAQSGCASDPTAWATSCLQSANSANGNACSSTSNSCLCKEITTNGNFAISNDKCISDGCINDGSPHPTQDYSSASAAQKTLCASYTATAAPAKRTN